VKDIAVNRQAFQITKSSKSLKPVLLLTDRNQIGADGRVNLKDAYGIVKTGEVWLLNCHINPYSHGNYANHEPLRTGKLC